MRSLATNRTSKDYWYPSYWYLKTCLTRLQTCVVPRVVGCRFLTNRSFEGPLIGQWPNQFVGIRSCDTGLDRFSSARSLPLPQPEQLKRTMFFQIRSKPPLTISYCSTFMQVT